MDTPQLDRIERMLKQLLKQQPKAQKTWVKASVIMDITGWDSEGMRKAREHKYVLCRKDGKGYEYLLESLNEVFIINKKAPVANDN